MFYKLFCIWNTVYGAIKQARDSNGHLVPLPKECKKNFFPKELNSICFEEGSQIELNRTILLL